MRSLISEAFARDKGLGNWVLVQKGCKPKRPYKQRPCLQVKSLGLYEYIVGALLFLRHWINYGRMQKCFVILWFLFWYLIKVHTNVFMKRIRIKIWLFKSLSENNLPEYLYLINKMRLYSSHCFILDN